MAETVAPKAPADERLVSCRMARALVLTRPGHRRVSRRGRRLVRVRVLRARTSTGSVTPLSRPGGPTRRRSTASSRSPSRC